MSEQTATRFSNQEELEQLGTYKRFNFVAVLGALLGLASSTMLLNLFLWLIPSLAVFCGILALYRIRKSQELGGYALAWSGIGLALFFTSWAGSHLYFQRLAIYQEAEAVATDWFELVFQGEAEIAHQAMLHPSVRQASGLNVREYYGRDEKARRDRDKVFQKPPVSGILALGDQAHAQLIDNITQDVDLTYAKLIRQVYRVSAPNQEPIDLMVSITRAWKDDLGRATWIVADVTEAERAKYRK